MKHALAVVLLLAGSEVCRCCCAVTVSEELVTFTGQANIIVWDPSSKTEHFIRNARFETGAADLGFIAPTPSIPTMEEVDPEAFSTLAALEPKVHTHAGEAAKGADNAVDVLQVVEVAGYRATTLAANDEKALAKWMKANGYVTTPAIEKWTRFYLRKKWVLTAFKVLNGELGAQTGVVKMSFATDRPFNPYYVPADNAPKEGARKDGLMVFLVAPGVYRGHVPGQSITLGRGWSAPIPDSTAGKLKDQLKLASLPATPTVTFYRDYQFPNPQALDDIYFAKEKDLPESSGMLPVAAIVGAIGAVGAFLAVAAGRFLKRK